MNFETQIGISGTYELKVFRPDGTVRKTLGPFKNLITDFGLSEYCGPYFIWGGGGGIAIGTGTNPPAFTDTTLQTQVARSTTFTSDWSYLGVQFTKWQSPNRWVRTGFTISFPLDAYLGTITEVGVENWRVNNKLVSRALLPEPLTLIPGDQLQVTWRLYHNLQEDDITQVVNIAGVPTTVTIRAFRLNATSTDIETGKSFRTGSVGWQGVSSRPALAYESDVLQAAELDTIPSGSSNSELPTYPLPWPNGTIFEVVSSFRWALNSANFPTGIGKIIMQTTDNSGAYQFSFSPKIPKTSNHTLTFRMKATFTRGTPPE